MSAGSQRKVDSALQLFLRIKHPSLDPAKISGALGMEPEHAKSAGEAISAAGRRTLHSESYWIAQLPTAVRPMSVSADVLRDYKTLATTAVSEEKTALQLRLLARNAHSLQGLTKDDVIELIGASPIELILVPWLRKFSLQSQFFSVINADGGSVTLVVQLRNAEHSVRIRPMLSRRLAAAGIELEIDWAA